MRAKAWLGLVVAAIARTDYVPPGVPRRGLAVVAEPPPAAVADPIPAEESSARSRSRQLRPSCSGSPVEPSPAARSSPVRQYLRKRAASTERPPAAVALPAPLDAFERAIMASPLGDPEKAEAIHDHREQIVEQLARLGIKPSQRKTVS